MNPIIVLCVIVSFDWRTNDVTMIYDKAILRSSCHTSVSVYWAPPNQEESVPAALVLFFFLFPPRRVKSATHREHTQATRTESAKTRALYLFKPFTMFFGGDPFAHMHGGHGGGGRRSARSRDVDTSKLYETLGVSRRAASALCRQ